ncbi:sigma-70 family RNA polymerase sigma factor [Paenibacillus ginsengarvi]|uniref:Sigma-70 family RNA polymerase sigma factor n=1 Tax=Paenibacillus ginsengarvi TaxID=400777 RepID=A0A3B0AW25_9BACL|nr:sigma-70 family RNA polymerase sigma factor [Paenibacillus ginsengarvi]RKN64582.1 sigma-70 family RNA polymerase sigma factor [Paenibacillus ginsengarvi]
MDSTELVRVAKQGDDEAFFQLVSCHKEKLYRIALGYLKNEEDALEAVHEATCRAYTKLHKLRKPQFFGTWIVRILMNYCLNELRRRRRQTSIVHEPIGSGQVVDSSRIVIETAIDKLEPRYQQIIFLKYYEDYTIREIAEVLGRKDSTVKTWLYRALKGLRSHLRMEEEDR